MTTFLLVLLMFTTTCTTILAQQELMVNITILHSAITEGAVCLDGSPPAYHFDRGNGSGLRSWIILLDAGGWCESIADCYNRSKMYYGSSKEMGQQSMFGGIFHSSSQHNPEFYNWNRVRIKYCDGASFTGDVEEVDPDNKVYYRGARIFKAVMDDLMKKGMQHAENAILTGSSAGGLATILNCDKFKFLLPNDARVKCVADAGFFVNGKTIAGHSDIEDMYDRIVTLHGSAKNLPQSCTSIMKPSLCFFPQYAVPHVQTPLFLINSAYDSYQINKTLVPDYLNPQGVWDNCRRNISKCTNNQRKIIQGFGVELIKALKGLAPSNTRGYFITSCHTHGGLLSTRYWYSDISPRVHNKGIGEAVADWYFDRAGFQHIDPYPYPRDCAYTS